MRRCGICLRAPREDDPMGTVMVEPEAVRLFGSFTFGEHAGADLVQPGNYQACSPCIAKAERREFQPRVWARGRPVPRSTRGSGDGDISICGICRLALREDEQGQLIRLDVRDIKPEETDLRTRPGGYSACPDCIAKYRPRIYARLKADNFPGIERITFESFSGDWLT